MIFISHRGNLTGPDWEGMENTKEAIDHAISNGFDCEVDLWLLSGRIYLGHDRPIHKVEYEWLERRKDHLWCHAKDVRILQLLLDTRMHCFFHDVDAYTLTSKGLIWTYPSMPLTSKSICVLPERSSFIHIPKRGTCYGMCSDHISQLRKRYDEMTNMTNVMEVEET